MADNSMAPDTSTAAGERNARRGMSSAEIEESIRRPEITYTVNFGGGTERVTDDRGELRVRWVPDRVVKGIAYDTPVAGYRSGMTDLLRLWSSEAVESFGRRRDDISPLRRDAALRFSPSRHALHPARTNTLFSDPLHNINRGSTLA